VFDQATLNRLYRYCYSLCDQESDAFDLLQSGIERCLKVPPEKPAASYAYALRIIRNVFIDQYRRKQKIAFESYDEATLTLDYDIASLEDVVLDRTELEVIWPSLSIIEREILFLWAVEGYSTDEVAGQLDKPRNTVLSIIYRMRKRLGAQAANARGTG
jgi:RNA polymerase sigma-70 factor (ECF subfamily)